MRVFAGLLVFALLGLGALSVLKTPDDGSSDGASREDTPPPPPSMGWHLSPPSTGEAPESERDLLELEDQLADDLHRILERLVGTERDRFDREALVARLKQLLDDQALAEEKDRPAIAASLGDDLLRRRPAPPASLPEPGSPDDLIRQQALRRLARAYAAQLRLRTLKRRDPDQQHQGKELRAKPPADLPAGITAVPWSTLSGLPWKEGEPVPPVVRELDGKTVGLAGWMVSLEGVEDVRSFALVESNWSCCFGVPAEVIHVVVVSLDEPSSVINAPVVVIGELDAGPEYDDGYLISFWRLRGAKLRRM